MEKSKREKEMEKEIKTEIEYKEYKDNEKKKNAMKWNRRGEGHITCVITPQLHSLSYTSFNS